jgi:hypothetical protein
MTRRETASAVAAGTYPRVARYGVGVSVPEIARFHAAAPVGLVRSTHKKEGYMIYIDALARRF